MASMVHSHQLQQRACRLLTHVRQAGAHNLCRLYLADGPAATDTWHNRLQAVDLIQCDAATHANQQALLKLQSCHYSVHNGAAAFQDGLDALHNSDCQINRAPLQLLLISQ